MNFIKHNIILIGIILFSLIFRLIYLDKVPTAISGDELTYVFTAQSVTLSGKDIYGNWSPWQGLVFQYPKKEHQAELSYIFLIPFIKIFGNSLFWVRFPTVLMGILLVFFIYLVTKRLFDKKTGLIAAAFAAINPWFIFMSRTDYEMVPAALFYLTSLYFMLDKNKKKIYVAIPFLLLSFYSYIGTKLIFLSFILIVSIYAFFTPKKRKLTLPYMSLIFTGLVLTGFFIYTQQASGSRLGELFLPSDPVIQQTVDTIRKATIQNPILSLLINKGTIYLWTLIGKTFSVISPSYLFFEGDLFFSIWHGFLYPIDLICVFFGMLLLISKEKRLGIFILLLLIISIMPQVFHKNVNNFSSHTTLFIPFLIIISSYGCKGLIELFHNKLYQRIFLTFLILIYSVFFLNFFHTYFFRYPLSRNTEIDVRTLSRYLELITQKTNQVVVLSGNSADLYKKYIYYSNRLQMDSISTIRKSMTDREYFINNIRFLPCQSSSILSNDITTTIISSECKEIPTSEAFLNIAQLNDGGTRYKIFNDQLCKNFLLKSYPYGITLKDFAIEKLMDKHFCEIYITKF